MGGSRWLSAIFVFTSLMIVDDLDAFRRAFAPDKAQPPLVVDPDGVLAPPVTVQCLEAVSWDCRHVFQLLGIIQHS